MSKDSEKTNKDVFSVTDNLIDKYGVSKEAALLQSILRGEAKYTEETKKFFLQDVPEAKRKEFEERIAKVQALAELHATNSAPTTHVVGTNMGTEAANSQNKPTPAAP